MTKTKANPETEVLKANWNWNSNSNLNENGYENGRKQLRAKKAEKVMLLEEEEVKKMFKEGKLKTQGDVGDLVTELTGQILETILKGELDNHLGYAKYNRQNKNTENSRNGTSLKRVKTKTGEIPLNIPRDRENEFLPALIPKNERELSFFEDHVLMLYAKGVSERDIGVIIKGLYGYSISAETVSKITDRIKEDSAEWHNRPLEEVYGVVFMDGFFSKVRVEGSVRTVCVHVIIGIKMDGRKECLGFWINSQEEGETSKYWLSILNEIRNRGVEKILIFCVDNLVGISQAILACFPEAEIQKCIVHQIRNSLKYVAYKDKKEVIGDLKAIYKSATEGEGFGALEKFKEKWGARYPNVGKGWTVNWKELSVYFKYPPEIRRLIYTTNPIESVNRGIRRRTKTRSVFPSIESLGKVVYLALDEMEQKQRGPIADWKLMLSQLRIYFEVELEPYLKRMNLE